MSENETHVGTDDAPRDLRERVARERGVNPRVDLFQNEWVTLRSTQAGS